MYQPLRLTCGVSVFDRFSRFFEYSETSVFIGAFKVSFESVSEAVVPLLVRVRNVLERMAGAVCVGGVFKG